MRKDLLRNIVKEVKKDGTTSRAYFVPTIEEADYLLSKGITSEKKYTVCSFMYGSWLSEYYEFNTL